MKRLICGAASDELIREAAAADQPPSLFRSPSGARGAEQHSTRRMETQIILNAAGNLHHFQWERERERERPMNH